MWSFLSTVQSAREYSNEGDIDFSCAESERADLPTGSLLELSTSWLGKEEDLILPGSFTKTRTLLSSCEAIGVCSSFASVTRAKFFGMTVDLRKGLKKILDSS